MVDMTGVIKKNIIELEHNPFSGPEIESIVACTEPQVEILTACLLGGNTANLAFNESITLQFTGKLDAEAMSNAFDKLITRHEGLRSAFGIESRQTCIFKSVYNPLFFQDLSSFAEEKKQATLKNYIQQDSLHLFDLVNGPLLKGSLLRFSETEHYLTLTGHHIVCDGWSLGIILQDLGKLYSADVQNIYIDLPKPALFSRYAKEQAVFLQSKEYAAIEQYWINQFADNVPAVNLPTDTPRPAIRTYKSSRLDFTMEASLIESIKAIGAKNGCSLVTTLLVAFETFVSKITGQDDIVIGLPAAGQSLEENFYLIGHCVNLLPLRSKPKPELAFTDYLKIRKKEILDAYDHQQLTFGSLLQKLKIQRDSSRIPLVPVVFNIDMGMDNDVEFSGLKHKLSSNPRQYENFELFLNISGGEKAIKLEWSYNAQLFTPETIKTMMKQFEELLAKLNENAAVLLKDIDLGNKVLPGNILTELNDTNAAYPAEAYHKLFNETALKFPNKTAIAFEDQQISYKVLDEMSNSIAHYLINKGIATGDLVGVALDRSPLMVITLLAVMKAGAAYIPLDPEYPEDRIAFILEDAAAEMLITSEKYSNKFTNPTATVFIERALEEANTLPQTLPDVKVTSKDLAYVLYTSGSTGKPKGVLIEHHNLVNLLYSMLDMPGFTKNDVLLAVTTIAFDIAGLELFLPLMTGATMILANVAATKDGNALLKLIEKERVTVIQATPSTYKMMLAVGWTKKYDIKILCCGEPMSKDLANKLIPVCGSLYNMYGPTETTIYSTGKQVFESDEQITIGKPINNTQVYIVDDRFKILPEETIGEICICGDGLARGYLNRQQLTDEKFIEHPFRSWEKMYRTGDLGKILKTGEILCLGRIDNQIKLRGYRIEAGEIENKLLAIPGIEEAVVLCKENRQNDPRLIAYIVTKDKRNIEQVSKEEISNWKKAIGAELPAYMVPSHFEVLQQVPLTPNGKIDRKALPNPFEDFSVPVTDVPKPYTNEETIVADIWKELLDVKDISLTDNFFEMGGHSLIAIEVMMRIEKITGKKLPPSTLFQFPTIEKLAAALTEKETDVVMWKSLVPIKTTGTKDPVYIIHGAGLDVMIFNNIARHMDADQPVYGVKAKGKDGDDEMLETIPDMAAFYISEIIQQNPNGPYCLIGFSAGSVIAFEMARQLKDMNREVKLLGIVDYDIEELGMNVVFNKKLDKKTIQFFPRFFYILRTFFEHPKQAYKFQKKCVRLRYITMLSRLGIENDTEELEGLQLDIQNAIGKYAYALKKYMMKPLDIKLTLFSTTIKVYYVKDKKFLGWKPYALRGIDVQKVPGDHDDMVLPPNDKRFAEILQNTLNKA